MAQRMPMGSILKTNVYYKTPFWRQKGYSGEYACFYNGLFSTPSHSDKLFLGVIINDAGPVLYGYDDCKPVSACTSICLRF